VIVIGTACHYERLMSAERAAECVEQVPASHEFQLVQAVDHRQYALLSYQVPNCG
jgi:hypothetical protein